MDRRPSPLPSGRILAVAVLVAALVAAVPAAAYASALATGDAAWARRAEGQRDGRAEPGPIREAIAAYEQAIVEDPASLEPYWKLLRALWFAGDFAEPTRDAARARYERGREVSERAADVIAARAGGREALDRSAPEDLRSRLPESDHAHAARFYFWSAVNLGAWSRVAGLLQAVRAGVANRLHDETERAVALDAALEEGGPLRLLSRLHAELPKIPLLSGFVDRKKAMPLAEQALREYPQHPGNPFLLGLTILDLDPDRRDEGLRLVEDATRIEPRRGYEIEDLAVRKEAVKRMRKELAGSAAPAAQGG